MPKKSPIKIELIGTALPWAMLPEWIKSSLTCHECIPVELTFGSQAISLCVRDNGQGFNLELQSGKGFGIVGMRERIQSLGGQLTIASQPGQGTEVTAIVLLRLICPPKQLLENKMHHEPETTHSHLDCR